MSKILQPNEKVVLKLEHSNGYDEIVLTDKNLVFYVEKKHLFKEKEEIIKRYPLSQINIINGEPQVYSEKTDFMQYVLKINVGTEVLKLDLDETGKENTVKWINAIYRLLVGRDSNEKTMLNSFLSSAKGFASKGTEILGGAIGGTLGSIAGNIRNQYAKNANGHGNDESDDFTTIKCCGCSAPITGKKGQVVQCSYCGTKQKI